MNATRKTKGLPPRKELARAQQALLTSALTGEALPGGGPIRFADTAFVLRHESIYLVDENVSPGVSGRGLPKPLKILSRSELAREAGAQGDLAYLHFQPPRAEADGSVWLTLEGKIASGDKDAHPMGLSSVQVKFLVVDGRLTPAGESRGLAE